MSADARHATGLDTSGLCAFDSHLLLPPTGEAFGLLAADAAAEGFELRIVSAHRSFDRQRQIWNEKLCGRRRVLDDADCPVDLQGLPARQQIECVLRFSALPGASRHHWGTDIDVFDAAAVPAAYRPRLDAGEVAEDGVFGPLHRWLDDRIAYGKSHGFYRPYDRDRGGVAPERWHLSYAPLAARFSAVVSCELLLCAWDECAAKRAPEGPAAGSPAQADALMLRTHLERDLEELFERYVTRVAAPDAAALAYDVLSSRARRPSSA